jgi:hypothetical protein
LEGRTQTAGAARSVDVWRPHEPEGTHPTGSVALAEFRIE